MHLLAQCDLLCDRRYPLAGLLLGPLLIGLARLAVDLVDPTPAALRVIIDFQLIVIH